MASCEQTVCFGKPEEAGLPNCDAQCSPEGAASWLLNASEKNKIIRTLLIKQILSQCPPGRYAEMKDRVAYNKRSEEAVSWLLNECENNGNVRRHISNELLRKWPSVMGQVSQQTSVGTSNASTMLTSVPARPPGSFFEPEVMLTSVPARPPGSFFVPEVMLTSVPARPPGSFFVPEVTEATIPADLALVAPSPPIGLLLSPSSPEGREESAESSEESIDTHPSSEMNYGPPNEMSLLRSIMEDEVRQSWASLYEEEL